MPDIRRELLRANQRISATLVVDSTLASTISDEARAAITANLRHAASLQRKGISA